WSRPARPRAAAAAGGPGAGSSSPPGPLSWSRWPRSPTGGLRSGPDRGGRAAGTLDKRGLAERAPHQGRGRMGGRPATVDAGLAAAGAAGDPARLPDLRGRLGPAELARRRRSCWLRGAGGVRRLLARCAPGASGGGEQAAILGLVRGPGGAGGGGAAVRARRRLCLVRV